MHLISISTFDGGIKATLPSQIPWGEHNGFHVSDVNNIIKKALPAGHWDEAKSDAELHVPSLPSDGIWSFS
ncbi:hypothetical protein K492DRAFT_24961 [Lichtheimia hyalospora FSU 10163]|nr:hypothetical protein K492DRAFT_24961 [Lichtheimia hyalospora FSU 10163]